MSRAQIRSLARMRAKAAPILAEQLRERERERKKEAREATARDHLIRVVTVSLKGEPKIDEPLVLAWRRVHEHFGVLDLIDKPVPPEFFYERIVQDLSDGRTPNEKLTAATRQVPNWLQYFCFTDHTTYVLDRNNMCVVPSIKQLEKEWKIPIDDREAWPFLPMGKLEPADSELPREQENLYFELLLKSYESGEWTKETASQFVELVERMDGRGPARGAYLIGRLG
jgi:hypothetical protein